MSKLHTYTPPHLPQPLDSALFGINLIIQAYKIKFYLIDNHTTFVHIHLDMDIFPMYRDFFNPKLLQPETTSPWKLHLQKLPIRPLAGILDAHTLKGVMVSQKTPSPDHMTSQVFTKAFSPPHCRFVLAKRTSCKHGSIYRFGLEPS